jgi:hypothetical protein
MNLQPCSGLVALLHSPASLPIRSARSIDGEPPTDPAPRVEPLACRPTGDRPLPSSLGILPAAEAACRLPCSDGSPCLLPGFPLRFLRLPDLHLAALTLHPSKASFQLGWIRSSQPPPEFALDRGRDQVRFLAFPESRVSSLTCTSAPNFLRVPRARQAAHAFPALS